jgi:putative peptidoglycan lipid II flippase
MVSAEPIIRGLLQYGAFTPADTAATAMALAVFSAGLPAYILIKVLTPAFHARSDMKTPLRYALVAIAVNLVGNLILIWPLEHVGPPLATAIASWVNVLLLYAALMRRGHFSTDKKLNSHLIRLLVAAVLMALALLAINRVVDPMLARTFGWRVAGLTLLVGGGVLVYAVATFATKAFT